MFTGIVEQIGTVVKNKSGGLAIAAPSRFASGVKIGASISVNGACLTIVQIKDYKLQIKNYGQKTKSLRCMIVPETLRRTNLGLLQIGDKVNLERAMKVNSRFEGHIVQGHIDIMSKVKSQMSKASPDGAIDRIVTIAIPKQYARHIVPKGSIAVDGISLTVVAVGKNFFTVAIIPHTFENTIVPYYTADTVVNIEVDILAKYVERLFKV